jgi:hypothetical protein
VAIIAIGLALLVWGALKAFVAFAIANPRTGSCVATALGFLIWQSLKIERLERLLRQARLQHAAAERPGQDIGNFARDFPRRSVDTWAIRATYEELRRLPDLASFPIRADDPLDLLFTDPDELDDILRDLSERTGRPLDGCEANPFYGTFDTVGQLVSFVSAQPLVFVGPRQVRPRPT